MPRLVTSNQYQNIDFFLVQINDDPAIQVAPTAVDPNDPNSPLILDYELGADFPVGTSTIIVSAVRNAVDPWTGETVEQVVASDPFEVVRDAIPDAPAKPIVEIVFD